jgi:hypothetical protein
MSELREDLDRALRTVTAGPAPVEEAIRRGKTIRFRRRAALLASAVAVVAVAAGYPALTRSAAAPPPAPQPPQHAPHHDPVVTDGPAGTQHGSQGMVSSNGVVAEGYIGASRWQATFNGSCFKTTVSPGSPQGTGSALGGSCGGMPSPGADPADFQTFGDGTIEGVLGSAAQDVTYFVLTFTDGQQLKLIPVTWQGTRYVAWVAPASMTIASIAAHLGSPVFDSGVQATAVPFGAPRKLPLFGIWLRPGQPVPPRATTITTGSAGGRSWAVTAYEGPWGTCWTDTQNGAGCAMVAPATTTAVAGGTITNYPGGVLRLVYGQAAPGVSYLVVTLTNGRTIHVQAAVLGNEKVFAFALTNGQMPKRWAAYDTAGKKLSAGTV